MHPLYAAPILIALASALPSLQAKPSPKPLPLLIWHGLGDRFDADGLQSTGELAQDIHPGTFVYYIRTDDDGGSDRTNTFFGNVTTQLANVCAAIHDEPGLLDPDDRTKVRADALGFSQGGQFLRALVQTCEGLSVRSLVTFGSQHNGIAEFQECGDFDFLCKGATGLITNNVWTDFIQGKVVPAQYYREVNETTGLGSEEYLAKSNFLAQINNEKDVKVERYKEKIAALERFVMFVFEDDETVIPKETGWFADVNATTGEITLLEDRLMYREDWLGLKELDKKGGMVFRNTTGKHMELSDKVLIDAFLHYFGPERELTDGASFEMATGSEQAPLLNNDDEEVDSEESDSDLSLLISSDLPGYREWAFAICNAARAEDHQEKIFWMIEAANAIMRQVPAEGYQSLSHGPVDAEDVYAFDEQDAVESRLATDDEMDLLEDELLHAAEVSDDKV